MSTDTSIENEIQAKGLTAPRITPADIEANIASEYYFTAAQGVDGYDIATLRAETPDQPVELCALNEEPPKALGNPMAPLRLLTFCVLVLRNGFTVTGESACASPENFDPDLGRKIARRNAEAKIWPLLGFQLCTALRGGKVYSAATEVAAPAIMSVQQRQQALAEGRGIDAETLGSKLPDDQAATLPEPSTAELTAIVLSRLQGPSVEELHAHYREKLSKLGLS